VGVGDVGHGEIVVGWPCRDKRFPRSHRLLLCSQPRRSVPWWPSENRDRREEVGKRGNICVSARRIARDQDDVEDLGREPVGIYLTRTYASLARFYRFRSRFSILGQPPIAFKKKFLGYGS
jgi:hypothetical protein